jgi:hypothetical protein
LVCARAVSIETNAIDAAAIVIQKVGLVRTRRSL